MAQQVDYNEEDGNGNEGMETCELYLLSKYTASLRPQYATSPVDTCNRNLRHPPSPPHPTPTPRLTTGGAHPSILIQPFIHPNPTKRTVAVVHVKVQRRDPLDPVPCARVECRDPNVGPETEPHCPVGLRVVPRWSYRHERRCGLALHHGVNGSARRARRPPRRLPRPPHHLGVVIDLQFYTSAAAAAAAAAASAPPGAAALRLHVLARLPTPPRTPLDRLEHAVEPVDVLLRVERQKLLLAHRGRVDDMPGQPGQVGPQHARHDARDAQRLLGVVGDAVPLARGVGVEPHPAVPLGLLLEAARLRRHNVCQVVVGASPAVGVEAAIHVGQHCGRLGRVLPDPTL